MDAGDDASAVGPLSASDRLAEQFYAWEQRGRGWQVWAEAVEPEPPFCPFRGHRLSNISLGDDGRTHTLASAVLDWLQGKWSRLVTGSRVIPLNDGDEAGELEP